MTALRSEAAHLSPCVGLALGSTLLRRIYDLEPAVQLAEGARVHNGVDGETGLYRASAVGALLRDSFHRNMVEEPLRPTTNRSLPCAHLSASLTGHVLGLAWRRPGSEAISKALRVATCSETGYDVPKLARKTGVTIARFERLVAQVAAADDEADAPLPYAGSAILLRHLWLRSSSREDLWTFLATLEEHYGPALSPDAHRLGRQAWIEQPPFGAADMASLAVLRAARHVFSRGESAPSEVHASYERLAAALALGGSRAAPLLQGRYGYDEQPPVADCAEMVARELLNALLWDPTAQAFDSSRLPPSSLPELLAYYAPGGPADRDGGAVMVAGGGDGGGGGASGVGGASGGGGGGIGDDGEGETAGEARSQAGWHAGPPVNSAAAAVWFELVSNRKPIAYLAGLPGRRYEMAPTVDNVATCVGVLLGVASRVRTPEALGAFWNEREPERRVELRTNAQRDRMYLLECSVGSAGSSDGRAHGRSGRGDSSSSSSSGGGGKSACGALSLVLELVMSERLNHAFAIHHWRPPAWQREAALLASHQRSFDWWQPAAASPPRAALLPTLLQPVLRQPPVHQPVDEAGSSDGDEPACCTDECRWARWRDERRWRRLRLLSSDPSDPDAVATSVLRLLELKAEPGSEPTTQEALTARAEDEMLAARVLAHSKGLVGGHDDLLLRVAHRVAASDSAALRRAASLEGPLAAPVALLCAKKSRSSADAGQAIASWGRAATASSLGGLRQVLRCTVRAAMFRAE